MVCVREKTKKVQNSKNDVQLISKKMIPQGKSVMINQICSKNHQLREKTSIEKHEQKLKSLVKRIPAAQKCIYSFDVAGGDAINYKETRANHVDDAKKSPWIKNKKKKLKLNYLKYQRNISSNNVQLSDIEKQIKNIQLEKNKINQLIFKELRDTKSNWQEIRNKTSLLNMKNAINHNNDLYIRDLCGTLEKTTKQVDDLYHSFIGLDNLKGKNSNHTNQINNEIQHSEFPAFYGEQDKEISKFENSIKEKIYDKINSNRELKNQFNTTKFENNLENSFNVSVGCTDFMNFETKNINKFLPDLNISARLQKNDFKNNDEQFNFEELDNLKPLNEEISKTNDTKNIDTGKQNFSISIQVDTTKTIPHNVLNKCSVFKNMLPEVFKSEYLRKSCIFD